MSKRILVCSIILLSFLLGNYNIELGFALKPFMITSFFLIIFLLLSNIRSIQLSNFDYLFFTLSIYGGITVMFSPDIIAGLRLFILSQLCIVCYLTTSAYFTKLKYSVQEINNSIIISGFLFNIFSFILYFIGLYIVINSGDFTNYNGQDIFGLTIDRGLPRMIGLTFDPNFFVMFNIIFFYFLAFKKRNNFESLTFILVAMAIIFSLSRGGILAIALPLIFNFFQSFKRLKISKRAIGISIFIMILILAITLYMGDYVYIILEKRFGNLGSGSGRTTLIYTMFELIASNPLFGVGWHNFRYYNNEITGNYHYGHNTFLELLTELGLVGFFLYCLFLIFVFHRAYQISSIEPTLSYLKYSFWAFMISMFFLSSIVNEVFFLYLILLKTYYTALKNKI